MIRNKLLTFFVFCLITTNANASFNIQARTAILQDFLSGEILYEKEPDKSIYPASMTKIMTAIVAFDLIKSGDLKLNEKFIISRSSNINIDIYNKIFSNKDYISIISNENIYKTIDMCRVAIAASGTITLQIALKKVPMCIFYKLSILSYFLAKFLVKIKFISLVNIVLEKNAIKEFIQNEASSTNIFNEVKNIVSNDKYKNKLIADISLIEKKLLDNKYKFNINDLIENMLK